MSKHDDLFKFKIGQDLKSHHKTDRMPVMVSVVSREFEECPGGVQFHYHCRHIGENGISTNLIKFNEIELEACNFQKELEKFHAIDMEKEKEIEIAHQKMRADVRKMLKEAEESKADDSTKEK